MLHTFSVALTAILAVLCVILFAILLRRTGRVASETDHGILRLVIDLLFPCLIFDRILKTDAFSDIQNLWLPPLIGFAMTAIGILIGFAISALPASKTGLSTWKQRRTFAACVGILNYGYVPIPLIAALFPDDDRIMGVLFLMYLGVEISVWTLVIFSMMGRFDSKSWRHTINGPILAILISVPLNLIGNSSFFPQRFFDFIAPCFNFFLNAIHQIGQAAIPISLIMVGLTITELIHRKAIQERIKTATKVAFWSCLIRLLIMPTIILVFAIMLPCTIEIKRIMVVYGAMGSAVFPIVLTRHYNGNTETAFDAIMSNTLLSVLTLPFWIAFGMNCIG